MTEKELIALVAEEGTLTKAQVEKMFDVFAFVASRKLSQGRSVPIPGIGKLATATRAARTGRNPQTGAAVAIPEKTTVKLKPAKALRDAVNAKQG